MTYQVIARKYRPQTFKEVLGQEHITRTLQNAIEASRLHHAYLFTGVRGVGKTTVARILAKALNCEKAPVTDPCNKCKNCSDITSGNHMDVQEIDGASNTGVDDVREIRERLKYLPSEGKYKIYIIDEVHMLSTAAFNALLKTLEEPPAHVIFVFATTEPQKIPATILSRCQRYDFRRISVPVLTNSIKKIATSEKIDVEPDAVIAIASEAEGSMRDAQSLFDQAVAFAGQKVTYEQLKEMLGFMDRAQLREILTAISNGDVSGALRVVDDIFNQGGDIVRLAQEMLHWLRSLLVLKSTSDQAFLKDLPSEDREFMAGLVENLDVSRLQQMFQICYRQAEELTRSRYPKMLFEALCIQLTTVRSVQSVDQLMERVNLVLKGSGGAVQPPVKKSPNPVKPNIEKPKQKVEENAAPIPNPVDTKSLEEGDWADFLKWLKKERPQLSAILEHGIFLGGGNGSVNLQYSAGSIYGEMLKEDHRKKQLEEMIEKYFEKKYMIAFSLTDQKVSTQEMKRAKVEEKKQQMRNVKEETLAHDIVKEATSILEADIQDIKVKV